MDSVERFVRRHRTALRSGGPLALIFAEDSVELGSTVRHALDLGFAQIVVLGPAVPDLPDHSGRVLRVALDLPGPEAVARAVTKVIAAAPGRWIHYAYNAEYLFFPFCESRAIADFTGFLGEERRESVVTFTVDLYADDLAAAPLAVSIEDAWLDRAGYHALARPDPLLPDRARTRQMDFYGGLRWRHEEHIPETRRRIDRIGLFRARPGLRLFADHTLSDDEMNTYACPWHHSPTAVVASFRTAKALRRNPGSRDAIRGFRWRNSVPFEWQARQLMDLGLMEPGQWF